MTEHVLPGDIAEIADRIGKWSIELAGKTVVLSGGRGFLGRHFTEVFAYLNRHVLDEPVRLIALDNLIVSGDAGTRMKDLPHVSFHEHDVIEPFEWDGPVHYVIHAAGIASPYYYRAYPLATLEVCFTGTRNMLELATRTGARFIYFSSSEVYGDPDPRYIPMRESYRGNVSTQGPRACYDEGKRIGETLCYVFNRKFGTHANSIRPFNVFGPGMQERDYRVLPNFASRIAGGMPLNVYGNGKQTRTFCYITDAMVGFLLVMLRGVRGEVYNIGNPRPEISMLDLVDRLGQVTGRSLQANLIEYPDSYPADEPSRRSPNIDKARLQLDFFPTVDLNEGLRRFFTWAESVYSGEQ